MQTELLTDDSLTTQIQDVLWDRAAKRECIRHNEHGEIIIENEQDGRKLCFNCGGSL